MQTRLQPYSFIQFVIAGYREQQNNKPKTVSRYVRKDDVS